MKKQLQFVVCILLTLAVTLTLSTIANAQENTKKLYYNENFIYEIKSDNTIAILCYIGNNTAITIPDYIHNIPVKSIESLAFYGSIVENVDVSEGITTINDEAFFFCENLRDVTLPASLRATGQGVFRDCANLKSVSFRGSSAPLGNFMFYGCTSLEKINLPSQITSIPKGAFGYCTELKQITLPENLTEVCDYAFYQSGLQKITLPDSTEKIHTKAFAESKNLTEIICSDISFVAPDAFSGCGTEYPGFNSAETSASTDPTEKDTFPKPPYIDTESTTMGFDVFESSSATTATQASDPRETNIPNIEPEEYITPEGFYFGSAEGFKAFENVQINISANAANRQKQDLLALAYNARTMGDANNDERVNIKDVTQIRRYTALLVKETDPGFNFKNADVNTDGKVTIKDATIIQKYIADIITSLC